MNESDMVARACLRCGAKFLVQRGPGGKPGFCGGACREAARIDRERGYGAVEKAKRQASLAPHECPDCGVVWPRSGNKIRMRCATCSRVRALARAKMRDQDNPGAARERSRKWKALHPDRAAQSSRKTRLARIYGISEAEFDRLLVSQNGKCAICRSPDPRGRNWHIDHDHVTGQVRGLCCSRCNTGIGHLQDDPDIIRRAADYVQRHRQMKLIEM